MDWIGLAQDRDKWRALVNAIMSLRVSLTFSIFLGKRASDDFARTI
jgi:hypothetical protein